MTLHCVYCNGTDLTSAPTADYMFPKQSPHYDCGSCEVTLSKEETWERGAIGEILKGGSDEDQMSD